MEKKLSRWLGSAATLVIVAGMIPTHAFAMDEAGDKYEKGTVKFLPPEIWGIILEEQPIKVLGKMFLLSKYSEPCHKGAFKNLELEEKEAPKNPSFLQGQSFLQGFSSLVRLSIKGPHTPNPGDATPIPFPISLSNISEFLPQLRKLNLNFMNLNRPGLDIFTRLSSLQRLEEVDFSGTLMTNSGLDQLTDALPRIPTLTSLKVNELYIDIVLTSGSVEQSANHFLDSLRRLTGLRAFEMSKPGIGFFHPENLFSSLKELTKLQHLNLNFFQSPWKELKIPADFFQNLTLLKTLHLSVLKVRDPFVLPPKLESLDVSSSFREGYPESTESKTSRELAFLHLCKQLSSHNTIKDLNLSQNTVRPEEARELAQLTGLTKLDLQTARIKPKVLDELKPLSTLTYLDLSNNQIEENIQALSGFTRLQFLNLDSHCGYRFINNETIYHLGSFLPSMTDLRELNLKFGGIYRSSSSLNLVCQLTSLTNLSSLNLPAYEFNEQTGEAFETLLSRLGKLQKFLYIEGTGDYGLVREDRQMILNKYPLVKGWINRRPV